MLTGSAFSTRVSDGVRQEITHVLVNGKPVDVLDLNGNFFTQVEILAGVNAFSFKAYDASGQFATVDVNISGLTSDSELDLSRFADTTGSFTGVYGRTSFQADTNKLYVDLATRNDGTFSSDVPLLVGVRNISDPLVAVVGADGFLPDGTPYFDFTQFVTGGKLVPGQLSGSPTIAFHNPQRQQFDYELVFYGKLNEAPTITTIPDIEALAGRAYRYDVDATDPDNDTLTYRLTTSPVGMSIEAATGLISWTPADNQIGVHDVTVQVSDGRGGTARQHYVLDVIPAPPNRPPVITSTPVNSATISRSFTESETQINVANWSSFTFPNTFGNGDTNPDTNPNWQVAAGGLSVKQLVNANASVLLSDFDVQNERVRGQWRVEDSGAAGFVDDDLIGFVFGYQDPQHFYLFDWKQATQSFQGANASRGMTIKRIDADSPLTVADLWSTTGATGRVTSLYHNDIGWQNRTDYGFEISFAEGRFTIVVSAGSTVLDTIEIADDRYTSGKFGFYNYSQGEVVYSGFARTAIAEANYEYAVAAIDADDDTLSYRLLTRPDGMTINKQSGRVLWSPGAEQVGNQAVIVEVSDGRGGVAEQKFLVCVHADPNNHAPVIVSTPGGIPDTDQVFIPEISRTNNPNGNWSWGWKPSGTLTAETFSLYDATDVQFGKAGWLSTDPLSGSANASFNDTSAPITIPNAGVFEPGVVSLHPGNGGQSSVMRFAAPEAGNYSIHFEVSRIDTGNTDGYVITKNGILLQGNSVAGASLSTDAPVALLAGDFIDFAVAGQFRDGNTRIVPVITRLADSSIIKIVQPTLPQEYTMWTAASGGNNHAYRVVSVPGGISWGEAEAAARAAGGHLATLESSAENDFVYSLASANVANWKSDGTNTAGPWLGGFQEANSVEPGQGWKWLGSMPFEFTNWALGEPNNGGANSAPEETLVYWEKGVNTLSNRWNDLPRNYRDVVSYIIELESDSPLVTFTYEVSAIDPDVGDVLIYELLESPAGMTINAATGFLIWPLTDVANRYPVTVQVTDGRGGFDEQSFVVELTAPGTGEIRGTKFRDSKNTEPSVPANGPILLLTPNGLSNSVGSSLTDAGFEVIVGVLGPNQISTNLAARSDIDQVWVWNDRSDPGRGNSDIPVSALRSFTEADFLALESFAVDHDEWIMDGLSWRTHATPDERFLTENEAIALSKAGGGIVLGADNGPSFGTSNSITQHVNEVATRFGFELFVGAYSTTASIQYEAGVLFDTPNPVDPDNLTSSTTTYAELPHGLQSNGIFLSTAVFGSPSAILFPASSPPLGSETFNGVNYASVNHIVTTSIAGGGIDREGLPNWTIFLDQNQNARRDTGERSTTTNAQGNYVFTNLSPGTYFVREELQPGWQQTLPGDGSVPTVIGDGYADVVLDYFASGSAGRAEPFGRTAGTGVNGPVSVDVVLGPPLASPVVGGNLAVDWLSLPIGSYVTVGFNDESIIDGPGNDIFIRSLDPNDSAGESADVYVSSNLVDFVRLGTAPQGGNVGLDLATIGYSQPVRAVRIVGLDQRGASPGFDLVAVQVLPGSIGPGDGSHVVVLGTSQIVTGRDFGNVQSQDPGNQPPVFTGIPPATVIAGELLRETVAVNDPDHDPLSFALPLAPAGMTVHPTLGVLVWNPTGDQLGTHPVTLRVRDDRGGYALKSFSITVVQPNSIPAITSVAPGSAAVGMALVYQVHTQDADRDPLTFSLESPVANADVEPNSGILTWTPAASQVGLQSLTVVVSDRRGGTARQTFGVQVSASGGNSSPRFESIPRTRAFAAQLYGYELSAIDANGDSLTYTLDSGPQGMTLNAEHRLEWTPTFEQVQAGTHTVRISAADGEGGTASQEFTITVGTELRNDRPTIISNPPLIAVEDHEYAYNLKAIDLDTDPLLWSLQSGPAGMSLDPVLGTLRWTPREDQLGLQSVVVSVQDLALQTNVQRFVIDVRCTNTAPAIVSVPPTTAVAQRTYITTSLQSIRMATQCLTLPRPCRLE